MPTNAIAGPPLVEMKGIVKTFGGIHALNGVNLNIYPGEAHVIMGENGAGKSTLMKILSGIYQPSAGEIIVDGQSHSLITPKQAAQYGISIIYQELSVINELSALENLFVGRMPVKKGFGGEKGETKKRKGSSFFEKLGVVPQSFDCYSFVIASWMQQSRSARRIDVNNVAHSVRNCLAALPLAGYDWMPLAWLRLTHFSYVIEKDWFSYSGIGLSLGSEEDGFSRTTLTKLHQSTMYQAKAYSVAQADHRILRRGIFSFIAALQHAINRLPIIHGAPLACWRAAKDSCLPIVQGALSSAEDPSPSRPANRMHHGRRHSETRLPDRNRINIHEDYELRYWTKELGVTPEKLKQTVEKVGVMATEVRKALGK